MPLLDDLLDEDARQWQADIDRRVCTFRVPERRPRRQLFGRWAAAVATVAVVIAALVTVSRQHGEEAGGGQHDTPPNASCVGPVITVTPRVVARGSSVTVRGEWFADGCNDTGRTTPVPAMTDVPILLIDGARTYRLSTAHPSGERYAFTVTVRIPADAPTGHAVIGYTRPVSRSPLNHNRIVIR